MHGRSLVPPPVAAPPVPPPLAEETLPPPVQATSRRASISARLRRWLRDATIGGACLGLGWFAGQSDSLDRVDGPSSPMLTATVSPASAEFASGDAAAVDDLAIEYWAIEDWAVDADANDTVAADSVAIDELTAVESKTSVSTAAETNTAESMVASDNGSIEHEAVSIPPPIATESSGQSPVRIHDVPVVEPVAAAIALPTPDGGEVTSSETTPLMSPDELTWSPPAKEDGIASSIKSLIAMESARSILHPQCEQEDFAEGMESHGTRLKWADTPADAYDIALKHDKLVFLIHVSGNFEIPGFT